MGFMVCPMITLMLWQLASGALTGHLHLKPPDEHHAYFTGDNFFITCVADETSGATRLTWQGPTGKDITHTKGRVHVEAAPDDPLGLELVVEEVRYKDQGVYTCSAIVDGMETQTKFTLKVYLSIAFWGTPDVQTGQESADHMILCTVRADPQPIVSWYVNGTLIQDGPRRTITEDGLFIRNMKPTDAGNYTCRAFVVTPYSSQIKDKHIKVHVHYKPVWTYPDIDTFYGVVGSKVNMSCDARAEPKPTFEWFLGRTLLGNSPIHRILNYKWRSILQVKIKDASSFGSYVCLVSNSIGEIQKNIHLLEGVLPNVPSFTLSSEEPGILMVKISQSPYDSLPITGYKIRWKRVSDPWRYAREYLTSKGNEFVIQDLNFDTEYAVCVSARNAIGFSNFTENLMQRTKGLVAETVVDGSSVLSSTFNHSQKRCAFFQNLVLIMGAICHIYHQIIFQRNLGDVS